MEEAGSRRFLDPFYWFGWLPESTRPVPCWLVWTVSNPERRQGVPKIAVMILATVAIGLYGRSCLGRTATPVALIRSRAVCQNMGATQPRRDIVADRGPTWLTPRAD